MPNVDFELDNEKKRNELHKIIHKSSNNNGSANELLKKDDQ